MPERSEHCPFLNRADSRCCANFSLESLQHAFELCFDRYMACAVYHELLLERRQKRTTERVTQLQHARQQLVQVTIPCRDVAVAA